MRLVRPSSCAATVLRPSWFFLLPLFLLTSVLTAADSAAGPAAPAGRVVTSEVPSFELDIQPILTKAGCNTGPCHGKQRGQNGFQLSLLGFDSDFDYQQIIEGGRGRRVFPGSPDSSLLLQKAVAAVPHGGGKRFDIDSPFYQQLRQWIAAGAPRRRPNEPRLVGIRLAQGQFILAAGETARLRVEAEYDDGSRRDVTHLADYLSNDAVVVAVDEHGKLIAGPLPGETAVMARFRNQIDVAQVVIPFRTRQDPEVYNALPRNNFIDELVLAKMQRAGVSPSPPAPDHVFLRRVYQDLIGRNPSVEEARRFLSDPSQDKKQRLIDDLLERPEYAEYWANQWADLLRPNPYRVGIKAVLNYDQWIRQQFRDDVPYDEFVRRLITARGSTWRNGAVTLFRDRRSADEQATLVSQLFLGIRLECAKCHHHPFERWSQTDFYQFAAFFADVGYKGTGLSPPISGGEEIVVVRRGGKVQHPRTGETLVARPLFGPMTGDRSATASSEEGDLRERLWEWMTDAANPYFAQVHANRLWAALMQRGLVEPVDDLRATNPPSNPELLAALGDYLREHDFRQKELLRAIAASQVYSLSSAPTTDNIADRINYSRHYRHRLRGEVLLDAIADFTETPHRFSGMPEGSRATEIWTHRIGSQFLDTFGRPDANQDPPCERSGESTVRQTLHLMNSPEIDQRTRASGGRAARLAASPLSEEAIVEDLYLAAFSRFPTPEEQSNGVQWIRRAGDRRREAIEDLMWALLNAPEFFIQN
ncbi:MAG: S-layer protein [Pirellulaceae bacterium]|nr:MAG: S-layer protein [Pirellulaceae bacterium]